MHEWEIALERKRREIELFSPPKSDRELLQEALRVAQEANRTRSASSDSVVKLTERVKKLESKLSDVSGTNARNYLSINELTTRVSAQTKRINNATADITESDHVDARINADIARANLANVQAGIKKMKIYASVAATIITVGGVALCLGLITPAIFAGVMGLFFTGLSCASGPGIPLARALEDEIKSRHKLAALDAKVTEQYLKELNSGGTS